VTPARSGRRRPGGPGRPSVSVTSTAGAGACRCPPAHAAARGCRYRRTLVDHRRPHGQGRDQGGGGGLPARKGNGMTTFQELRAPLRTRSMWGFPSDRTVLPAITEGGRQRGGTFRAAPGEVSRPRESGEGVKLQPLLSMAYPPPEPVLASRSVMCVLPGTAATYRRLTGVYVHLGATPECSPRCPRDGEATSSKPMLR